MVRAGVQDSPPPGPPLDQQYLTVRLAAGLPALVELLPKRYTYGGHPASVYDAKTQFAA